MAVTYADAEGASEFRPAFFDPLSTAELTAIICSKFEEQPALPLSGVPEFTGAGLYAIYYVGNAVDLYRSLVPSKIPVYVGSAQSHNSATGIGVRLKRPLSARVRQHAKSINEGGLDITEFAVRLLLMPDVHIDLGENGLRVGYQPVWNSVLTGFGSNEQGRSTRRSARTRWDTVHEGRNRTYGATPYNREELIAKVRAKIEQQLRERR